MKISKPKIVVFANEVISLLILKKLNKSKIKIHTVFTSSLQRKKYISDWADLKKHKNAIGCNNIFRIENPNSKFVTNKLKSISPDYILSLSWSQILSKKVLDSASKGTISFHYSKLPKRRGGAPLFWALNDGLKKLGVTIFYLTPGIDDGDIINQIEIPISKNDHTRDLLNKIYLKLPDFFCSQFKKVIFNKNKRIRQDNSKATYTKSRKPSEGLINFNNNFKKLNRFVRALSKPYPGAFFYAIDSKGNKKKFIIEDYINEKDQKIFQGYLK